MFFKGLPTVSHLQTVSVLSRLMELMAGQTDSVIDVEDVSGVTLRVPDLKLKPDQHLHHGDYCRFAKFHDRNRRCSTNKERSVAKARSGVPFWGTCPFGVWDLAYPILEPGGKLLAVIYLGYFRGGSSFQAVNGREFDGAIPPKITEDRRRQLLRCGKLLEETILLALENWRRNGGNFEQAMDRNFYRSATERFIATHFDEPVRLSDFAAQLRTHPNHLGKMIHRAFGRSFRQLVQERRIEQARILLLATEEPVTSLALACGFQDSNYFSVVFHRETGCTPREYRRRGG